MSTKLIKCVVAGSNANGEPDFWFVIVRATQQQYDSGEHYKAAKAHADDNGFESSLAYDENDPPKPLFEMFKWDTADTIDVEEVEPCSHEAATMKKEGGAYCPGCEKHLKEVKDDGPEGWHLEPEDV